MNYKLKVSEFNLSMGRQCSPSSCPIALALRDRGFKRVFVGGGLGKNRDLIFADRRIFRHTEESLYYIRAIDRPTTHVEPTTIHLEIVK